jgi:hypothetical protein
MKFNSKAHMAQELIAGKRFENHVGGVIFYDASSYNPYRYDEDEMSGVWDTYCKDIWTEIECEERHVHQDLIDSYKEGQAWQYSIPPMCDFYSDCKKDGAWVEPEWSEDSIYRLHPYNDLIQAHRNGAEIQYNTFCGKWVDTANPNWLEVIRFRIKPTPKVVYEWMYKSKFTNKWLVEDVLMCEKEAKDRFRKREYRKTGRSWEV